MKRLPAIITAIIGAALTCSCGGLKKMPQNAPVTIEAEENLVPRNGILPIRLTINVPDNYRNLNNGLQIRPIIRAKESDKELALPPMVIEGKLNRVYNERMSIYKPSQGDSITYRVPYHKGNPEYSYETEVPYEGWFSSSEIIVDIVGESYHRKVRLNDTGVDKEFTDYSPAICTKPVERYWLWERPETAEAIQSGADAGNGTTVTFPVASADMSSNKDKTGFERYMDKILNHPEVKDYHIQVKIANSPEGSLESNAALGQVRKKAVEEYLASLGTDPSKTEYILVDENWSGLADLLPELGLEHQAEILEAVSGIADPDERERYIRDTWYQDWRAFRKVLYPQLRLAEINVKATYKGNGDYYTDGDSFSFEEDPSLEIYEIHLQLLDAVKDRNYVLAARLADRIPNTGVPEKVLSNKATVYLMNGRLDDARVLLERLPDSEPVRSNLGMIYLQQERYQDAEKILDGIISINAAAAKMYAGKFKAAADILSQLPASEEKDLLSGQLQANTK